MSEVLIVEDDATLQEALSETMKLAGFSYHVADHGLHALELLEKHPFQIIVSDIRMDHMGGQGLLDTIQKKNLHIPVILMTAYGSIDDAVQAMKSGAVDYIQKPFSAQTLVDKINVYLRPLNFNDDMPIAEDVKSKNLLALALKVALSDINVMISGESGTGKEVLAQFIHHHSKRKKKPFVAINCAAIPEHMLEATLFGYAKGAFTGAYKTTEGKFEQAQGGTLLLDEVSEMSLPLQAKLLRVLQEKEVERIGDSKMIELDVRVLATTNRNLVQEVKAGRFREDLYYRLNVFPLEWVPLRERKDDILPLVHYAIQKYSKATLIPQVSDRAKEALLAYSWPGNARELENCIQRALLIQNHGCIEPEHLHFHLITSDKDVANSSKKESGHYLKKNEFDLIEQTLLENDKNRTKTAKILGISERTLRYKLAKMREEGYVI